MKIKIKREGVRRQWFDAKGKYHEEEVVTVWMNGVRLVRGYCWRYAKRVANLAMGESRTYELVRKEGANQDVGHGPPEV